MSTIAFKEGIMSGDGQLVSSGMIVDTKFKKVLKTQKFLVGIVGNPDLFVKVVDFVTKTENKNPTKVIDTLHTLIQGSTEILLYERESKALRAYSEFGYIIATENLYAMGSGACYALTAMTLGLSSEEAVLKSSEFDPFTNDKIISVRF